MIILIRFLLSVHPHIKQFKLSKCSNTSNFEVQGPENVKVKIDDSAKNYAKL